MYVHLIRSKVHPDQHYTGLTTDIEKRLADHNMGRSPHTNKFKPSELVVAIYFADPLRAEQFERYLKHGSGHAFARRHFW